MPKRRFPAGALLAVPLLLAALAYLRVLPGEFVFDDLREVVGNPALADPGAVIRGYPGALLGGGRPTTALTYALDHARGGLSPRTFHATGLLLHLLVTVLVWAFTRAVLRLAGRDPGVGVPLAVAGLFALHPLQSEAVAYVSQRAEVLASGLYLGVVLALLGADREGPGLRGALLGLLALVLFALGMGAKAIVVTAPVAWLLLVGAAPPRAAGGGAAWRWRGALLLPFVIGGAAVAWGALRSVAGRPDAGFSVTRSGPAIYLVSEWRAIATYLRLLAWPSGQTVDWWFPLSGSATDPAVIASGLLLAAVAGGAAVLWWRSRGDGARDASGRAAACGVGWFFLLLVPTSTVLPLADVLVEHRVYLASWGAFLAVALGGEALLARVPPGRRLLAGAAVVGAAWLALGVALHRRNAVWESALALWSDAVEKGPAKSRPRLGLGVALARRGEASAAVEQFRAGLARAPGDATGLRVALLHGLGGALVQLGRPAEAVGPLREAVALEPDGPARQGLALALWSAGDVDGAGREAELALARDPRAASMARVLGQVRMARGDDAGAVPMLEQALRARPEDAPTRYDLGAAYANLGRVPEACAAWKAVLRQPSVSGSREAAARGLDLLGCPP